MILPALPLLQLLLLLSAFPAALGQKDPRPLVDSSKLRRQLTRSALLSHAHKLSSFAFARGAGGNRGFGGPGHNATINYVHDLVAATGAYDVYLQPFAERYAAANGSFAVDGEDVLFYPSRGSPRARGMKALLAQVRGEGCTADDYPPDVEGKIVLFMRGNCTVTQKSNLAFQAGAVGCIIYNSVPGTVLDGRLLSVPNIVPTGAISLSDGLELIEQLAAGEKLVGELDIDSFAEDRVSYNVIAQTKSGDPNKVVVVGAHSDSVPLGPGINDNGSGTIGILELLLKLKDFKLKNAVRFCWFSAEEFGLLGAHRYVENLTPEENLKIAMYINSDMIGSPNYVLSVYDGDGSAFNLSGPAGSAEIEDTLTSYFTSVGRPSVPTAFTGRSDYGPFLTANIPSGGLFTGAEGIKTREEAALFGGKAGEPYDANYHQPGDTVRNLDLGALVENTKAIAWLVAKYGRSLEGFPRRTLPRERDRWAAAEWTEGTHGKFASHDHAAEGGCGDGLY
ncbi:hypothetical protein BZA05DRAFT_162420 [Tricharina praecox]|uniref:uncharacterized protein n=1 Tax=Tricharina praecox TaxID=43433 RepID=UPI002220274D|nr:uncharacterized protein BZA05DRAFT_162420 [Tricharina praecox]KAI5856945.1 hypothetical protein BZA05DRAFT_162420 [Tricharina praecox]